MSPSHGQTLSVLVVGDDEAFAELVRAVLNDVPGWGATVVHDAAAAREVFYHVRIEVLVVDVDLPGISGHELLHLLRNDLSWYELPEILISARPDQPDIREVSRRGLAVTFIPKPFDADRLVAAIRAAVSVEADDGAARRAWPGRAVVRPRPRVAASTSPALRAASVGPVRASVYRDGAPPLAEGDDGHEGTRSPPRADPRG